MSTPRQQGASSSNERLAGAIAEYLEALDAGENPDRDEFLARHADVAPELELFFSNDAELRSLETESEPGASISPSPPLEGRFGDYEILGEIARGGMGVVYRARQTRLNRLVALKTIRGLGSFDTADVQRFRLEAKAAANLHHSHIVPVHEYGEHEGQPYIAMKLIEGESLAAHLPQLVGHPRPAARLIETLAGAVHYAHERGVLHRDIKPGNILVDRDGEPHLSDFGLVRLLDSDSSLTRSGALVGTPSYMSPEQASGRTGELTTAADVYSLGVVLYELLVGKPPFRSESSAATLRQVAEEEPVRPSKLDSSVPRDLETICLRCLEKEPHRRYASARELADDLGRFLSGRPINARPTAMWERAVKWARRRPTVAGLILVSLLALLVVLSLGVQYLRSVAREAATAREARELANVARRILYADRMVRAYERFDRGKWRTARELLKQELPTPGTNDLRGFEWYHLWRALHPERLRLRHRGGVGSIVFSPDGQLVGVATEGEVVKLWSTSSWTTVRTLSGHADGVTSLAFSPDSKRLVTGSKDGTARIWRVASAMEELVLNGHGDRVLGVAFSPDGTQVATASRDGTAKVWDPEGGNEIVTLHPESGWVHAAVFSPDGDHLATGGLALKLWSTRTWKETATQRTDRGKVLSLCFSRDGATLWGSTHDGEAVRWTASTLEETGRLAGHGGPVYSLSHSVDGDVFATCSHDGRLEVRDVDSLQALASVRVHENPAYAVAFSPDGRYVLTGGHSGVVKVLDAADLEEPLKLSGHRLEVRSAVFSTNGRTLVSDDGSSLIAWTLRKKTNGPAIDRIRTADASPTHEHRALSPDGIRQAGVLPDGTVEVVLQSSDDRPTSGKREAQLPVGGGSDVTILAFSTDSTLLAAGAGRKVIVWRRQLNSAGSAWVEHCRFTVDKDHTSILAFSPDAKMLATAAEKLIELWDVAGKTSAGSVGQGSRVRSAVFSPDSRILAVGREDGVVSIWSLERLAPQKELTNRSGLRSAVKALAFSSVDRILATGGDDGTIKLWDLVSGPGGMIAAERATLRGHRGPIKVLAFSPDGTFLVSGGAFEAEGEETTGEMRVWRTAPKDESIPEGSLRSIPR